MLSQALSAFVPPLPMELHQQAAAEQAEKSARKAEAIRLAEQRLEEVEEELADTRGRLERLTAGAC